MAEPLHCVFNPHQQTEEQVLKNACGHFLVNKNSVSLLHARLYVVPQRSFWQFWGLLWTSISSLSALVSWAWALLNKCLKA